MIVQLHRLIVYSTINYPSSRNRMLPEQKIHHDCFSVSGGLQSSPILLWRRHIGAPQTHSCCCRILLNMQSYTYCIVTITTPGHCSPVTRKLPPMVTPRRPFLGEGRFPVCCHADVPGVSTSVEESLLLELSCPPVTIYTCTTQHNN